jgi:hypothetical protein
MPSARRAIDLFLQLGLSGGLLTAGLTLPAAVEAQHSHHGPGTPAAPASSEGGEGGEGGEGHGSGHGAALTGALELQMALAQMEGHLLIAEELLHQGDAAAAEPHVSHPVDELYGAVAPALEQRRGPAVLAPLEGLRQQVRLQGATAATQAALEEARRAIQSAEQRLDSVEPLALVRALTDTAVQEYAAAVAEGRVVEVIEYQDARGFLLEAQRRLQQALPSADAPALHTLQAMLRLLPSAQPPAKALASPERLQALQRQL